MKFFAARSTPKTSGKKTASGRGRSKAAPPPAPSLNPDRILDALGILLAVAGIVILLSFLSQSQSPLMNALIGPLSTMLGWGAFLAPLAMVAIGLYLIARHFGDFPKPPLGRIVGGMLAYATLLALLHAMFAMGGSVSLTQAPANAWGGTLGHSIFRALTVFGSVGAIFVLLATLIIACSALFGMTVAQLITGVQHLWQALLQRLTGRAPAYDDDGPRINRNMRGPSRDTITPPWDPGRQSTSVRDGDDDGEIRINGLKPTAKTAKQPKREWVKPAPAEDDDEPGVQLPLPKPPKAAPVPPMARKAAQDDLRINVGQRAQPPAEFPPSNERKAQAPHVIGGTGAMAAAAASSIQMQQEPAREWVLPQVPEVLEPGREATKSEDDIRQRARMIEDTLLSFGVPAKVTEVNPGPTITQFCVEPGFSELKSGKQQKVKVSRIAALSDDLALALAAPRIRIEAPVPGKSYVGIEVPNGETALVSLRDVMESEEYDRLERKTRLRLGLGSDVSGRPVVADLTAMPHLLIAGTTGSGKSVCVNSIITALLINNSPEDCRLLMVDPKRVELTGYNGIPHLIAPVVVDVEQVGGVLKWTTNEMDRRYRMFAKHGARNITDWNGKVEERKQNTEHRQQTTPAPSPQPPTTTDPDFRKLPYIVLFIDELADLMMLAPDETEKTICRLAQMARATGIHLIIATQRPSVDVVTGLIKANFPARVAFTVASAIDSRVILDGPGAEKLLGRGDMLVLTPDVPAPQRAQGCFLSDKEIQKVVRHWRAQSAGATAAPIVATQTRLPIAERPMDGAGLPTASTMPAAAASAPPWETAPDFAAIVKADTAEANSGSGTGDSLFDEAVATVRLQGKASISLLQRRLRIGYTRAARMIEEMEEKGIVGPNTPGSQFRDVLPPKG